MSEEKKVTVSELNIYQRLSEVMKEVSYIKKEDKKVNGQYTFASHDAVTAKIRPYLIKNGIVTIPRVVSHTQDGNRTEVDIEIDFVNIDNPEDKIVVPTFGYGIDNQDKGVGKAISYAVKYAYLKVLALETGDDPERDTIDYKVAEPPEADVDMLLSLIHNCEQESQLRSVWTVECKEMLAKYKSKRLYDILSRACKTRKQLLSSQEGS